jgi:NCAIR mutase (PurE)-related protein
MNHNDLENLLQDVRSGTLSVDAAIPKMRSLVQDASDFVHVDLDRPRRCGQPEAIFGEGKTADEIIVILQRLHQAGQNALATRLSPEKAEAVHAATPGSVWHRRARIVHLPQVPPAQPREVRGTIAIVCAGTSDLHVAEEAAIVAEIYGNPVERFWDVGVAGIHRLMAHLPALREASVIIVVAGMEGALASVVSGLVSTPIVAVPTSVGYGASFGGVAALLAMLNSCAAGVGVVNIDNGFGAAVMADRINRRLDTT